MVLTTVHFMYARSQKFGYFEHWLSDVNTVEMKNFDTLSVCCTFNYKPKISTKPQMLTFDFCELQIYFSPAKFHLQPCQTYVWLTK